MTDCSSLSSDQPTSYSNPDEAVVRWVKRFPNSEAALTLLGNIEENPGRITRGYAELLCGYDQEPIGLLKATRTVAEGEPRPGWVEIDNIEFVSMCPHHFLPYFGIATVRYRPARTILGLGKFPRFVDALARRLVMQEDLTRDIVHGIAQAARTEDVRVSTKATHICICYRGVRQTLIRTVVDFVYGS